MALSTARFVVVLPVQNNGPTTSPGPMRLVLATKSRRLKTWLSDLLDVVSRSRLGIRCSTYRSIVQMVSEMDEPRARREEASRSISFEALDADLLARGIRAEAAHRCRQWPISNHQVA